MNLFILDAQPEVAARFNNDFHVRKIILEAVEMMGLAYDDGRFEPLPSVVYSRHVNHPMSKWVRRSRQNFDWTLIHTNALLDEFTFRRPVPKEHAYRSKVNWICNNIPLKNLPDIGMTDPPRCFGIYHEQIETSGDIVYDYRRYYMMAKRHIAKWTRREIPEWWV